MDDQLAVERPVRLRRSGVQQFERLVIVVAVIGLALTGLPQTYAAEAWAQSFIRVMGGIESVRIIHRVLSLLLIAEAIFHVMAVIYRRFVFDQRESWLAGLRDWRSLFNRMLENFGFRQASAQPDSLFSLRIEYLVLVVSVAIMIVTGFVLWNPVTVTSVLPGETVPTARVVHGNQALLLVAFLVVWRFLIIFLWRPRVSVARGAGAASADDIARRRNRILPIMLVVSLLLLALVWLMLFDQQTAIDTVPRREAVVFAPQLLSEEGDPQVGAALWATLRCAFCHGETGAGGTAEQPALRGTDLTFDAFYQQVREGGGDMPAFSREELPDGYVRHLWAWLTETPEQPG